MKTESLRGVNLGGWLLIERWMTPSLFSGTSAVDEYTFMQTPSASEKIEQHRQEFITEEDFRWLKDHHVNAIRLPVGYWVLDSDEPFTGAKNHLDWAMSMADRYQLKVLIDVHGLPGSQNGRDHSGRIGRSGWYGHRHFRDDSIKRVMKIAKRYANRQSLWGIQVINEPRGGLLHWRLRRYYQQVYEGLSQVLQPEIAVVFSDAFTPRLMSGAIRVHTNPVVMDVHSYHMATALARFRSVEWFFGKLQRRRKMLKRMSRRQPIIIGEWSGVLRHQSLKGMTKERRHELFISYVALQQEVYGDVAGHFYWNYKTEGEGQWNFRAQVEVGNIKVS